MDSGFAALDFLARLVELPKPVHAITRLRLDAALYEPAPTRPAGQSGRPRRKGARLPTLAQKLIDKDSAWLRIKVQEWYGRCERDLDILSGTAVWCHAGLPSVPVRWVLVRDPEGRLDPQGFLCTQLDADPAQILAWLVRRWQVEVTFQEARAHLGVETQRQWSDLAIARTTPLLLGLYSVVTWLAHPLSDWDAPSARDAAWYLKPNPTFSDTIAHVRRHLWAGQVFSMSEDSNDSVNIPRTLYRRITETICYSA